MKGCDKSQDILWETLKGAEVGEILYHTSLTLRRADLIALMELIARLTGYRLEEIGGDSSDG